MNLSFKKVIACLLVCVAIAVFPLLTNHTSDFGGSDDAASDEISQIIGHEYEPWASPVFEPPGSETESLLFWLQAALGAGVFGFGLGVLYEKNKKAKKDIV